MKLVVVEDMMNDLLFALSQKKEEKDLFISPIEQFIIEVKSIQSQDGKFSVEMRGNEPLSVSSLIASVYRFSCPAGDE